MDCSLMPPKDATLRNFTKAFMNSHKIAKFTTVFSLESFLLYTVCFLFSLDWAYYQWTGIGDEGASALADPRVIKNFKTLNLFNVDLTQVCLIASHFSLRTNDLTDSGAITLARALQENKSLEKLQ